MFLLADVALDVAKKNLRCNLQWERPVCYRDKMQTHVLDRRVANMLAKWLFYPSKSSKSAVNLTVARRKVPTIAEPSVTTASTDAIDGTEWSSTTRYSNGDMANLLLQALMPLAENLLSSAQLQSH